MDDDARPDAFPHCVQDSDGRFQAWYPEQHSRVHGDSRREALQKLPVRRAIPRRDVVSLPDGGVRITLPDLGCAATGRDSAEAESNLRRVIRDRIRCDPDFRLLQRKLAEKPPEGWTVEFLSREELLARLLNRLLDGESATFVEGVSLQREEPGGGDALSKFLRGSA